MGRLVFGAASLSLAVAALALHDQLASNWQLPGATAFIYFTSIALAAGSIALVFPNLERFGALLVGAVYAAFALTFVPDIFAHPLVYASYGNVFYALALVAGAMGAYGLTKTATGLLGLCSASFAIEQVEFLARTASLVPTWMPPGQMFWAIVTTAAFALAAISLILGYHSLPASRLLALMFMIFGVVIWIPLLIAYPGSHSNWSEGLETFAIGGAVWIIAEARPSSSRRAEAHRDRRP
jgi:hypothetical protein